MKNKLYPHLVTYISTSIIYPTNSKVDKRSQKLQSLSCALYMFVLLCSCKYTIFTQICLTSFWAIRWFFLFVCLFVFIYCWSLDVGSNGKKKSKSTNPTFNFHLNCGALPRCLYWINQPYVTIWKISGHSLVPVLSNILRLLLYSYIQSFLFFLPLTSSLFFPLFPITPQAHT